MKKTIIYVFTIILLLDIISCKKESILADSQSSLNSDKSISESNNPHVFYKTSSELCIDSIVNDNGTLKFASYSALETTISCLESAIVDHFHDYVQPLVNQGLSQDSICKRMITDSFFAFQPLLDFEDALGFHSLRQDFWPTELAWMNGGGGSDPNETMYLDRIAQAIVNPDYKVEIVNDNISLARSSGSCRSNDREPGTQTIDGTHRLQTWVGFQYWGSGRQRYFAESWAQYKSGSLWLGGVTQHSIGITGWSHFDDCSNSNFGTVPSASLGIARRSYSNKTTWSYGGQRYSYRGEDLFKNTGYIVALSGYYNHSY